MEALNLLQENYWLFYILVAIIGLVVGSFLNVVIYRLPVMLENDWKSQCKELLALNTTDEEIKSFNLAYPASTCVQCGHKIRFWENIPVLSYLFLKGKCSECQTKISPQYPLIELATGILSAFIAYHFGITWQTLATLALTWSLIALTVIDFKTQLLPDNITLPLLWLGIIANIFGLFTDLETAILGAIFGYLVLWLVFQLFKLVTGKEGMGFGDFKLLAALGAWMGWEMLPLIIILSSFVGAAIGIAMIVFAKHDRSVPIPFGPYLAIAGWIAMIWGDTITKAWLGPF